MESPNKRLIKSVARFFVIFVFTNILIPIIVHTYAAYTDEDINFSWMIFLKIDTLIVVLFIICLIIFFLSEIHKTHKDTKDDVTTVIENARSEIHKIHKDTKDDVRTAIENARSVITETLNSADIVLKIDIEDFDPIHIKVMQGILIDIDSEAEKTGKDVKSIYALDASSPALWWSGSALGYFAIQSRWVSKPKGRKIHRFFVLDETSLASNQTKKLLQLHVLMGLETYIILEENYDELCEEFRKKDPSKNEIEKKEFLVWDEPETITVSENETGLNLGRLHGYQSLWFVKTPHHKKMTTSFPDIGQKRQKNAKDWTVKFEFIPIAYKHKALIYHSFSEFLTHQAKTCTDDNAVEDHKYGCLKILHVPLDFKDKTGVNKLMDIDTMNAIFGKYIKYHSTKNK